MPAASVRPYIPDERARSGLRIEAAIPAVVLAALVAIAFFAPRIQPGPFIPSVTVVNASEYSFDVEVAGAKADDWMLLATASDHASTAIETVFDQGSRWTFRFSVQGRIVGTVAESRAELAAAGWRVVIPERFTETLRTNGVVPTA